MIEGPVVAVAERDVHVFRTVRSLEIYAEPIDVEDGVWEAAWDRAGTRLRLAVTARRYRGLFGKPRSMEVVVVEEASDAQPEDPETDAMISSRLRATGLDP